MSLIYDQNYNIICTRDRFRTKDTPVPPELVDHVHEIARTMVVSMYH